ncbi:hypothetical protein [Gracilimonas sp.]|uniref:hypothetical protein n=1 Tax=Gracilimonas sp. TaxID=1974203 RepID=UPI003BACA00D
MAFTELRYKDLLVALAIERNTVSSIFGSDKKYKSLVAELIKYDDETPYPLQKDLVKLLDISTSKLRELYAAFIYSGESVLKIPFPRRL